MASIEYLKQFDKKQLFRFFVDGRFHKKYDGWVKYDEREKGSVQAMMNGFSFMMDNFHGEECGLNAMYLLQLHRVCMLHVETTNPKSAPGDIRYLRNAMPFFVKTTTIEHIQEVLEMRMGDETFVFNDKKIRKTATNLQVKEVFSLLQKLGKLSYRPWYPNLDFKTQRAIDGKELLSDFYDAKAYVQKLTVQKIEEIVKRYNLSITIAKNNDTKLRAIALIVRELEMLHPFSDGNCRTFAGVLLNQLLLYNNFHPTMPYNPNLDGEYSLNQWIGEIKNGMEQTKVLLKDADAEVYGYSITEMSLENQKTFLSMASEFIKKIETYKEVFITPMKIQKYTKGTWHNCEKNMRFTGVGNSFGNLAFFTAKQDLQKANKSINKELTRLIKNGVRAFVVDDTSCIDNLQTPVYLVSDVLEAYEEVSSSIRQEVNPKTLLITGTEGKTGTKIQVHHLLEQQTKSHAILNSANAKIPVLRTLANLEKNTEYEIVEFSVDANEEKTIKGAKIVNPDICFFTNIGKEHMHNHKEIDGVIKAKSSVVLGLREGGTCIVNSSMDTYNQFVEALHKRKKGLRVLNYGVNDSDTARLINAEFDIEALVWNITANIDGVRVRYTLPLVQNHAPLMSVGVLLSVKECGLDVVQAAKDYSSIKAFESMGLIHKINLDNKNILFYDQSRRASISGVRSAFKDLQNFNSKGKIVALLGSISSVNENEWTQEYHEELAELINNETKLVKLYTTGSNMQFTHANLIDKQIHIKHSDDYELLYQYIRSELQEGDLLFVMGYMRLQLDKFAELVLQNQSHTLFDKSIYNYDLSPQSIDKYKKVVAGASLDKKMLPYVIANYTDLTESNVKVMKENKALFLESRTNLLVSFFENIDTVLQQNLQMSSMVKDLRGGGHESFLFNEVFCKQWFNNFDKIKNKPKKQLFGVFYKVDGYEDYFLFLLVGTVNIHIGIGKYKDEEVMQLSSSDQEEIKNIFGRNLPKDIKFESRSWGKKWVTIDAGNCIDFTKAKTFATMVDVKNSYLYKKCLLPLVKSVKDSTNV
ncbi:Fic family protein [Sulfurimonas sp. SAG-AH-194-I05]|nr:Mur ligase family protein [Sulfurimonas sp. SAG-AH-194-I05]MDF1875015.1 Fic family protein [Sulfurimonas sp. SAG-AH-194-I05]